MEEILKRFDDLEPEIPFDYGSGLELYEYQKQIKQFIQDEIRKVVEEIISISNKCEAGQETELNEWRAFKCFRNELMDWSNKLLSK